MKLQEKNHTRKIDPCFFEAKKKEMSSQILKLQQCMNQIITSANEKYIKLGFDLSVQIALSKEFPVLCLLELEGCASPVTFHCDILDKKKADIKFFLSTSNKEPNAKNCMRSVERLQVFKFCTEGNQHNFAANDVLYLSLYSVLGCTVNIKARKPNEVT